ncbi:MAG TPA: PBSX family phage terminase large subunit [Anaerolineae bacterium]|nr:PBSX family phage terminase large subunit [Anaerolineae bacterium]
MKLSSKQIEVIRHWNRERPLITINEGAVRSGKTFVDNLLFLRHVAGYTDKKVDFIITGYTVPSTVRNVLQPLSDQFGIDTHLNTYNQFQLFGNRLHVFGGDAADSYKAMTGMTSYGWYGNEVAHQHENTIREAFNRTSGEGFRIIWDTNPDAPEHPIKVDYIDKSGERLESGRERIKAFHWQLEDNPFLPAEYLENLKRSTPAGMWYDRSILGLWVAAEGLVYQEWQRDVHVYKPFAIPADWPRIGGIDLGAVHPFVHLWGALDPDKRLYIYAEHYKAGALLSEHAEAIKRVGLLKRIACDHDAQERMELESYGVHTIAAQKAVLQGIEKVAQRIHVQIDGRPRLYVSEDCPNLIREMGLYRWNDRKTKDEPIKLNDDCEDALRYLCMEADNPTRYVFM